MRLYQTSVGNENGKIERPASPVADVDYTEVCAKPFETFHSDEYAEILALVFLSLQSSARLV